MKCKYPWYNYLWYKYPRTPHLPYSPGATSDDIFSTANFEGKKIVITEKMDGENTSLYSNYYHARSIDSKHHESQSWLKNYHFQIAYKIPQGWRLCGENLYAKHSIYYTGLKSYFLLFSIWEDELCLSWQDTVDFANELEVSLVPVLYQGEYSDKLVKELLACLDLTKQEGIVVRLADTFTYSDFGNSVAKWVRKNHVTTDNHWKQSKLELNTL
jgi:hypothetical protein